MENKNESLINIIEQLRREMKDKDRDIYKAATFGKQLLDEKEVLARKLEETFSLNEVLEQDKYSLQHALETQVQSVNAQNQEIEAQRRQVEDLSEDVQLLRKEASIQKQRVQNLVKEKNDLEKGQEDVQLEIASLRRKIDNLEHQIVSFQHINEVSMIETGQEELLQAELNFCMTKSKELEDSLAEMRFELESTKLRESRLNNQVKDLLEGVHDRDMEICAFTIEIKNTKEEYAELQCEVEALKLDQVDVNRRGNSVFGELDDRRQRVEQEFKSLRTKYTNIKKNYEENKSQLTRCKGQMAILLSMTSRSHQEDYIKQLETSVATKNEEVKDLTLKLEKEIKCHQPSLSERGTVKSGVYNYLQVLLAQAEQKNKTLENEIMSLHLQNLEKDNDNIATRHNLYETKEDFEALKAENVKLKLELNELTYKPESMVPVKNEPRTEALPGFEKLEDPGKTSETENILDEPPCNPNQFSGLKLTSVSKTPSVLKPKNAIENEIFCGSMQHDSVYKSTTTAMRKKDGNCAQQ